MRKIAVVTVGRSDYGLYVPILRAIQDTPDLKLDLIVSGMHLCPEYGLTVKTIEADGFQVAARVEMLLASDTPEGIAKSMGLGLIGFAQIYATFRPDLLLVLGDRFEMYAATVAALPFRIPVAHVHGGEVTQGAIDDAFRHSMTKLSHLHFASTEESAARIRQMGEEPWRVATVGAPALDNLRTTKLLESWELEARYGISLNRPPLLVTFHPVTLEYEDTNSQIGEMLKALDEIGLPVLFTMPNADTNRSVIVRRVEEFVATHSNARLLGNVGTQGYFSLMARAAAMVGNSSSGIIEAPSFGLPVINIGTRQQGRVRAANVLDVGYESAAIVRAIRHATTPEFRIRLRGMPNPYGDGYGAERIVRVLRDVPLDSRLIFKEFQDMGSVPAGQGPDS